MLLVMLHCLVCARWILKFYISETTAGSMLVALYLRMLDGPEA